MSAAPYRIAVASGDGIGPEVCAQAVRVLEAVGRRFGHRFEFVEALVGGAAWDVHGAHLPPPTIAACASADAILFGSVGGPVEEQHLPKWKDAERSAILGMRRHFGLAINIRPSRVYPALAHLSPLKAEVIGAGVDIIIIRELLGGAYFGLHEISADGRSARDEMTYTWEQIECALRFGFETCVASQQAAVGRMWAWRAREAGELKSCSAARLAEAPRRARDTASARRRLTNKHARGANNSIRRRHIDIVSKCRSPLLAALSTAGLADALRRSETTALSRQVRAERATALCASHDFARPRG